MNKRFTTILWSFILTRSLNLSWAFSQKPAPAKGAKTPPKPRTDRQLTEPASPSFTMQPDLAPSSSPTRPISAPASSPKPTQKKRTAILDFDNSGMMKEWKAAWTPASRSLI